MQLKASPRTQSSDAVQPRHADRRAEPHRSSRPDVERAMERSRSATASAQRCSTSTCRPVRQHQRPLRRERRRPADQDDRTRRLINKLRSTDSIARLGGDEFAIVLEDVSHSRGECARDRREDAHVDYGNPLMLERAAGCPSRCQHRRRPSTRKTARSFLSWWTAPARPCSRLKAVEGGKYIRYSEATALSMRAGSSSLAG